MPSFETGGSLTTRLEYELLASSHSTLLDILFFFSSRWGFHISEA